MAWRLSVLENSQVSKEVLAKLMDEDGSHGGMWGECGEVSSLHVKIALNTFI